MKSGLHSYKKKKSKNERRSKIWSYEHTMKILHRRQVALKTVTEYLQNICGKCVIFLSGTETLNSIKQYESFNFLS